MSNENINLEDWLNQDPECLHNWILASKSYNPTTGDGNMYCDYCCLLCGAEKKIVFYNTANITITGDDQS